MNEIGELIDWSAVVKLLDRIYGSDEGRPSYPLLTYVNRLLLQQWYGLSDPGLEEAVDDRLSVGRECSRPFDDLAFSPGVGGFRRVRYIRLPRNACHLHLLCTAINLKRALALAT